MNEDNQIQIEAPALDSSKPFFALKSTGLATKISAMEAVWYSTLAIPWFLCQSIEEISGVEFLDADRQGRIMNSPDVAKLQQTTP